MGGSILRHDPFFSRGAASQAAGWDRVLDRIEAERKTGCNDGWQNLFLEGMLRGLGGFWSGVVSGSGSSFSVLEKWVRLGRFSEKALSRG